MRSRTSLVVLFRRDTPVRSGFCPAGAARGAAGWADGATGAPDAAPADAGAAAGVQFRSTLDDAARGRGEPARSGRWVAGQSSSSSQGQYSSTERPMSVQSRASGHAFFPGMRGSQGPDMNLPQSRSRSSLYMAPGMLTSPSAGRSSAGRSSRPGPREDWSITLQSSAYVF